MKTATDTFLREESLASWRLASNMAFNGLMVNAILAVDSKVSVGEYISNSVPIIGLIVSLSFLVVALMGLEVKYTAIQENLVANKIDTPVSKPRFIVMNLLGPYILSSIAFSVFWLGYLMST